MERTKGYLFLIVLKHLGIWVAVVLFFTASSLGWGWTISTKHETWLSHGYGALTNATIFYLTSFYLIPKFYNQRRKKRFVWYSVAMLSGICLLELYIDSRLGMWYDNKAYLIDSKLSWWNFILMGLLYILPFNLLYFILGFMYRLPKDRKEQYQRELQLEHEKLETELKYLKSQIHPHTLFNGINSIYHLVDTRPEKAKNLLLNLSNALRYHLYESSDEFSSLTKELEYVRQYIALNEIRINENAITRCEFEDFEGDYLIAPLLLTPFIENAFKYVSHHPDKNRNTVTIGIKVLENDRLYFECINTIDVGVHELKEVGGIGLENVGSRLQGIYGTSYRLQCVKNADVYTVVLELPLKEKL